MTGNVWQRLSLYESHDLVRQRYQECHGRELSQPKADELTACIAQGRQYFDAARIAGDLARPLLMYYGVLSLTRGLILFKQPHKRLTNLDPGHGVDSKSWGAILHSDPNDGYAGMPSEVSRLPLSLLDRGTFSELVEATGNRDQRAVVRPELDPQLTQYSSFGTKRISRLKTPGLQAPQWINVEVGDVLARIPDLLEQFASVFNRAGLCYPGYAVCGYYHNGSLFKYQTHFLALQLDHSLPPVEDLRRTFQLPEDVDLRINDRASIADVHPLTRDKLGSEAVLRGASFDVWHPAPYDYGDFPQILRMGTDRGIYLVPPLPHGVVLSTMSLLFLAAYSVGMLVRYYPSIWQAFLGRRRGDQIFPLLNETIVVIEQRYPNLILTELRNDWANAVM